MKKKILSGVDSYLIQQFSPEEMDAFDDYLYLYWQPLRKHPVMKYTAKVILSLLPMPVAEASTEQTGSNNHV